MRNKWTLKLATVVACSVTVFAAAVPAAQASYPGAGGAGRIAFGDDRSGAFEIYTMDVSGQHLRQLTANGAFNACPAWSPDRTKLAFCSDISGTFQIYVINADGSGQRLVPTGLGKATFPAWSPDGRRLLFTGAVTATDPGDVYTVDLDGSHERNLTHDPADEAPQGATWNPSGTEIVYDGNADGKYDLYTIHANGTDVHRITQGSGDDTSPAWSPDGRRIAYIHGGVDSGGNPIGEIFTTDPSGAHTQQVTSNATTDDRNPAWSPDGRRIVFRRSDLTGNTNLYLVHVATCSVTRVTDTTSTQLAPDWASR